MRRLGAGLVRVEVGVLPAVMCVRMRMEAKAGASGADGIQAEPHQHDRDDDLEARCREFGDVDS